MTPLAPKEQLLLASLLGVFVIGSGLLTWQQRSLDRELSGLLSVAPAMPRKTTEAGRTLPSSRFDQDIISISYASAEQLDGLPGIGPYLAAEIVRYRQASPFRSVEDLLKVPGIGPKKLEKVRNQVKVN